MSVLIWGLALALFGFGLHLVRWRIARPPDSGRALVVTMVSGILGGAAVVALLSAIAPELAPLSPDGPLAMAHAILLALALAAAYVMTYPAVEVESPTLVIVQAIARHGDEGFSRARLFEELNDSVLVAPRIQDLLDEQLAERAEDRIRLTPKGRTLARVFTLWRAVLGAPKGG
jgi:hypothetical protein